MVFESGDGLIVPDVTHFSIGFLTNPNLFVLFISPGLGVSGFERLKRLKFLLVNCFASLLGSERGGGIGFLIEPNDAEKKNKIIKNLFDQKKC